MPLVGFIDKSGKNWTFNQALTGLDVEKLFGYTRDILWGFVNQSRKSKEVYSNSSISATGILSCLRKTQLERIVPYFQEPPKLWHSLRGNALHATLDPSGQLPGWVSELRLYKFTNDPIPNCIYCKGAGWIKRVFNRHYLRDDPCSCCSISGQIDGYDALTQTLYDKKSTGDNGLIYLKDGAKENHIPQVNIYMWLMNGGYVYNITTKDRQKIAYAGGKYTKLDIRRKKWFTVQIPVNRLVIQYFSMMQLVLTGGELVHKTSFEAADPASHTNEISREVVRSYLNGNKFMKMWKLVYKIPEVPMMTDDEVVTLVNNSKHDLVLAFQNNTAAPMCDDKTRKWLCDYCGVKHVCDKMKDNEVIKLENYCTGEDMLLIKNGDKERVKEF